MCNFLQKKDPETVRVVVRCRPMSRKEVEDGRSRIVEMNDTTGEVNVRNPEADPREPTKPFTFDQVIFLSLSLPVSSLFVC